MEFLKNCFHRLRFFVSKNDKIVAEATNFEKLQTAVNNTNLTTSEKKAVNDVLKAKADPESLPSNIKVYYK